MCDVCIVQIFIALAYINRIIPVLESQFLNKINLLQLNLNLSYLTIFTAVSFKKMFSVFGCRIHRGTKFSANLLANSLILFAAVYKFNI